LREKDRRRAIARRRRTSSSGIPAIRRQRTLQLCHGLDTHSVSSMRDLRRASS
jgi:hypothetical protein